MNSQRYHYIDFLRVIAIFLMFIFHVNMIFVSEENWHIKDESNSNVLLEINYWVSSFRMPLLFLVSGYVSSIILKKIGYKKFIQQRFKRLIIPTVLCTILIVSPQIYFENKLNGSTQTIADFYLSLLEFKWYPEGSWHWLHLWFIPYLFLYNLITIPLVNLLSRKSNLDASIIGKYGLLLILSISIIPYTILSLYYPETHDLINDYARHSLFIVFIIAGIFFERYPCLINLISGNCRFFLKLAFLTTITINLIRWNGIEPFDLVEVWIDHPYTYIYLFLQNVHSWLWVLVLIGYGRKYLDRESALLTYANSAVYPFYILHQTVIVIIGFYVVQTPDTVWSKYWFTFVISFIICILVYDLFIKKYNLMRFIFGMKDLKNSHNTADTSTRA